MKTCTKCKLLQSKSEFYKAKSEKDGLHHNCKSCKKLYKEANKERNALKRKAHYESNKEYVSAVNKIWSDANKGRKSITNKALYENKREERLIQCWKWYQANKDRIAIVNKAYRHANRERLSIGRNNRRALERNSKGTYSVLDINILLVTQDSKCVYCKTDLIVASKNNYHIDHIMPLKLGGSNFPDNLQLLCPTCNLSKGHKHPDIYEKQINHNQNKEL